ncbi:putative cupredoxin-like copper-binding protein [Comamonas sp. BIGb0152]|uniref:cupredoxin domain-containing protein n=1 Tax=Comamonas sp. BIGb0152 TaxID=2940601 RepID=UPI002169E1FA|nr:cupredoxin family protein [Comamonas sp. BIGb0152]MCS4292507.1 putative cupredoxin-like copper-binding protein [Comamonas sp. BIGb0152]
MKTISHLVACTLLASASTAFAHGSESHAATSASAPASTAVTKEQKDWGIAGDAKQASRSIDLNMGDDMRFSPAHFSVKKGETLRLRVLNKGQVMHEVVLGTKATLAQHAQMMLKHPGMEHAEPYMAHVAPQKSEDLVWHFNRAGSFDFACLIPGHYQAGMTGTFTVTD